MARAYSSAPAQASRRPPKSGKRARAAQSTAPHTSAPRPAAPAAPAPVPQTAWTHALYGMAVRTPPQATPNIAKNASAPISDLKAQVLPHRAAFQAMSLYFRPCAPCVMGNAETGVQHAPPVAVPNGENVQGNTTASVRERIQQAKHLYAKQVSAGDYTPYLPGQTLHDASVHKNAPKSVEAGALIDADQALAANVTLHPAARRFIVERVAAHLGVPC